jgi:hypothetical protein
MQHSRRITESDFPPTAYLIIKLAVKLCHDARPDLYRTDQGYLRSPKWYKRMKQSAFRDVEVLRIAPGLPQA